MRVAPGVSQRYRAFTAAAIFAIFITLVEPVNAKAFRNCADVKRSYPNGVAINFAASGKSRAEINRDVYLKNQRLDKDRDGVICESELLQNPPTTTSSTIPRPCSLGGWCGVGEGRGPDLVIPVPNPLRLSVSEEVAYELSDEVRGQSVEGKRDGRDSATNKRKESRAIEIATAYMQLQGWTLARDCQRDGVGFDLEFAKGDETLLVEVKGIGGPAIAFNMTAKEWHLCTTNSKFLLIAVTNVLDDDAFRVNPLWPVDICRLQRRATQYRFESDHFRPAN